MRCTVAALACAATLGCSAAPGDETAERDPTPSASQGMEIAALATACEHPILERRQLTVTASLMPLGFREPPGAHDHEWSPSMLTDLTTSGDAVFVLDGMQQVVTKLDSALTIVAVIGRRGGGPGEFLRPSAIGTSDDGRIVVADPGSGRVTIIDVDSYRTEEQTVASLSRTEGVAMSGGTLYFSAMVLPETMRRGTRNGVALASLSEGEAQLRDLLDLTADGDAAAALLRLPGPNQFRVVGSDGRVLFVAPAAGTIDIIERGTLLRRVQHCVPPALAAAYDHQVERHRNDPGEQSQAMQPLVTDAMIVGDTLFVVSPLRDPGGDIHVVKYAISGELLGSTAARLEPGGFPNTLRFWGDPYRLIAFGMQGTVLRIDLTR